MPTFERTIKVEAPPEDVWSLVIDPSIIPKIYPDVISITSDPPGMGKVGQKNKIVAKVAGRKMEQTLEVTEIVPNKKRVVRQMPGGMMKTYIDTITIEPSKKGSTLTQKIEYEVSAGYLGKALGILIVNRTVKKNLQVGPDNFKELAGLKRMH